MRIAEDQGTQEGQHGRLEGVTITKEVLDSSPSVLRKTRNGHTTGLQAWFTPSTIASFVARVIGSGTPVIDLTAGSGMMLEGFDRNCRYGIEINPANHEEPSYEQIPGDAQRAVPMLRAAGIQFPAIAINPPYGLDFVDHAHGGQSGKLNSTVAAWEWSQDLLSHQGQGAILLGTDRLTREILSRPSSKAIYAIIDFPSRSVWDSVHTNVSLAFFINARNVRHGWTPDDYRIRMDLFPADLGSSTQKILEARSWAAQWERKHEIQSYELSALETSFKAVTTEYARRRRAQEKGQEKVSHDLSLKKNKIVSTPSPYARILLAKDGLESSVRNLHHQHINYFSTNSRAWEQALDHQRRGILTIDPRLTEAVAGVMADRERTATPLFPVKAQMRLGWLTDLGEIKCIRSDTEAQLVAGNTYGVSTKQKTQTEHIDKNKDNKKGEPEIRQFLQQRKLLQVTITDPKGEDFTYPKHYDESPDNIKYLAEHFAIPEPSDVATKYSDLYKDMYKLLTDIETEHGFRLKNFQKDHLSRLLTKGRGMLAHEQGLGKTLMMMTLAEASVRLGAEPKVLIISPQDLIPQWGRESAKFFGRPRADLKGPRDVAKNVFGKELIEIRNPAQARAVARRLKGVYSQPTREWDEENHRWTQVPGRCITKPEPAGWFITYYEALSQVGKTQKEKAELPHEFLNTPQNPNRALQARLKVYKTLKEAKRANGIAWNVGAFRDARIPVTVPKEDRPKAKKNLSPYERYQRADEPDEDDVATSRWACPKCFTDTSAGWTGEVCRRDPKAGFHGCGYVHRRLLTKPAYSALTDCFIDGVMCVDELSEMRGESQKSKAIRALARGVHKFGGTGTPMSNYIPDAFWGMWWTLGNATTAFPYDYREGKVKFEEDFAVIEYLLGRKGTDSEGQRQNRKVLPRITNVSQFWRLTQPSISRCRKEHTGEPLVKRTFHPTRVPLGVAQKEGGDFWMNNFPAYFTEMNPDHPLVEADLVERFEASLGLGWRMEFMATMPNADMPTMTWETAKAQDWHKDLSPWTPANLKVLELAAEHAARGEKVLIGSDLIVTGNWLAEQLNAKGIEAVHLTEEKQGAISTKSPRKRASDVEKFTTGSAMVMCAGINAMKLGHNLDNASAVIVHGLPYSHMVMDQFIARVHRLTSKKPVDIYVIVPRDTIAEQKWDLLKEKAGASDLAFDGELMVQDEEEKDLRAMLKEMRRRGFRPAGAGDEIEESQVQAEWERFVYQPTHTAPKPEAKITPQVATIKPQVSTPTNPLKDLPKELPAKMPATVNTEFVVEQPQRATPKPAERPEHKPEKILPAQQAKEDAAEKRKQRPKAKYRKQDTSLFEMGLDGIPVYEQDSLFNL